jgi:hypothetical protein
VNKANKNKQQNAVPENASASILQNIRLQKNSYIPPPHWTY